MGIDLFKNFQVEKVRLIGTSLLSILQEPSPFTTRIRRDCAVLIDILSRLDSKASRLIDQDVS